MEIRPLISALLRNKTGPVLVSLQVAITLAVIVNALYLIVQRIEIVRRPSGLDEANVFWILSRAYTADFNHEAAERDDLEYLNSLPGVLAATTINFIPMNGTTIFPYHTQPEQKGVSALANLYLTTERGLTALGVSLIAGRPFDNSMIKPAVNALDARGETIITRALAQKLFPNDTALGKTIYGIGDRPSQIIGIIDHMSGGYPSSSNIALANEQVALFPAIIVDPSGGQVRYLVRTETGRRDELMKKIEATLEQRQPGRIIIKTETFEKTRSQALKEVQGITVLLIIVVALVIAVAALGIFGLAMFNVVARTKQIGIRRAVGARKLDIVRYFMVENWIITTTGIVLGIFLSLAVGFGLSSLLQMSRLPLVYLWMGMLGLWILGQLAAWIPARRAAAIPPATATRTL